MDSAEVGGVHIKYLYHCHRQLWLYLRGVRPEHLSSRVALGEAVHETTYPRSNAIDLGAARLDHVDGEHWVHEVKSSGKATPADHAQAIHYCHQLHRLGVDARGAILHYPKVRRTVRIEYGADQMTQAEADIAAVLAVARQPASPPRLARSACRGCSYLDYCWIE